MNKPSKLNTLFNSLVPGSPITSEDLAALGISADLAVEYVRARWLKRLARGVFCHSSHDLELHPCLRLLQHKHVGLHVGGKSALDWHGTRQYLFQQPVVMLYGPHSGHLPDWFLQRFTAQYHRKRLFDEDPAALLHVLPFEDEDSSPHVSVPERALVEMLSEIGLRQSLQEARELAESTYNLRADVLDELLQRCKSVKTVRLCLQLGREGNLPWFSQLDTTKLPTGSNRPWVSKLPDGLLVLKPQASLTPARTNPFYALSIVSCELFQRLTIRSTVIGREVFCSVRAIAVASLYQNAFVSTTKEPFTPQFEIHSGLQPM